MTYQALALVRNHKSDEIVVLKQTRLTVQKELRKRDDELLHLKDLLSKSMRQRDEAQEKCQRFLLEKLLL